jgi:hypothetical protein
VREIYFVLDFVAYPEARPPDTYVSVVMATECSSADVGSRHSSIIEQAAAVDITHSLHDTTVVSKRSELNTQYRQWLNEHYTIIYL